MTTPFVPTAQPELVLFLERLLDRARAGEIQVLVCAAGVTPEGEPTGFDVVAHAALGDRMPCYEPAHRRAAYATVLEGLQQAASQVDAAFQAVTPPIVLPE